MGQANQYLFDEALIDGCLPTTRGGRQTAVRGWVLRALVCARDPVSETSNEPDEPA